MAHWMCWLPKYLPFIHIHYQKIVTISQLIPAKQKLQTVYFLEQSERCVMHTGSLEIPCGSITLVPHLNFALVNAERSVKIHSSSLVWEPKASRPKLGCVETSVTQRSLLG